MSVYENIIDITYFLVAYTPMIKGLVFNKNMQRFTYDGLALAKIGALETRLLNYLIVNEGNFEKYDFLGDADLHDDQISELFNSINAFLKNSIPDPAPYFESPAEIKKRAQTNAEITQKKLKEKFANSKTRKTPKTPKNNAESEPAPPNPLRKEIEPARRRLTERLHLLKPSKNYTSGTVEIFNVSAQERIKDQNHVSINGTPAIQVNDDKIIILRCFEKAAKLTPDSIIAAYHAATQADLQITPNMIIDKLIQINVETGQEAFRCDGETIILENPPTPK